MVRLKNVRACGSWCGGVKGGSQHAPRRRNQPSSPTDDAAGAARLGTPIITTDPQGTGLSRRAWGSAAHSLCPPHPLPAVEGSNSSLSVLLLDPAGDVEAPRVDRQNQGAEHKEAVHGAPAQDVDQVALRDAVKAKGQRNTRHRAVDRRRHILANAEDDGVRVLLVAPPCVLRLQLRVHLRRNARRGRAPGEGSRPQRGHRRKGSARAQEREEEQLHHV
mmetsp:Transcript_5973/g.13128  ORF Transcript_5973/g.13128 Transcript_5973/m.13128 type:complete len:219 (+) Transcript_5973:290-946(+)